jgi:organic hydroperoxide reductase OsmC/OhrA
MSRLSFLHLAKRRILWQHVSNSRRIVMTHRQHRYRVQLRWTGNEGTDPVPFRNHLRAYQLSATGKPSIFGSSDTVFRGDSSRWNPEDLLVASLSACHQLWYLGLCAEAGIAVTAYEDEAEGVMEEERAGGAGQFTKVVLRPRVTVAPGADLKKAEALHHTAHERCFIARSVNFPVTHVPLVTMASPI